MLPVLSMFHYTLTRALPHVFLRLQNADYYIDLLISDRGIRLDEVGDILCIQYKFIIIAVAPAVPADLLPECVAAVVVLWAIFVQALV